LTQTCPGVQALLQAPQLLESDDTSVHEPLQFSSPAQTLAQVPFSHAVPFGQMLPRAPQLFELFARFTHASVGP
jgi:hypothetical protein